MGPLGLDSKKTLGSNVGFTRDSTEDIMCNLTKYDPTVGSHEKELGVTRQVADREEFEDSYAFY